jgi:hypothetical protein
MPARQQALDDLVRAVKGIHDQASTTNDKGTFVNPQARKAAGNAMKALDVHLGATNQDDAGEAERIMKIAGHATDAAHALAGRGSQNPLVLQTSHLGHVHELANAYISKWNATRNPTGITGAFANNEQLGRKNPKKPAGGASTAGLGTPAPFAPETPSQGKK